MTAALALSCKNFVTPNDLGHLVVILRFVLFGRHCKQHKEITLIAKSDDHVVATTMEIQDKCLLKNKEIVP